MFIHTGNEVLSQMGGGIFFTAYENVIKVIV